MVNVISLEGETTAHSSPDEESRRLFLRIAMHANACLEPLGGADRSMVVAGYLSEGTTHPCASDCHPAMFTHCP